MNRRTKRKVIRAMRGTGLSIPDRVRLARMLGVGGRYMDTYALDESKLPVRYHERDCDCCRGHAWGVTVSLPKCDLHYDSTTGVMTRSLRAEHTLEIFKEMEV